MNKFNIHNKSENYVHAIDAPQNKQHFCPRCRVNTHNLRQCQADKRQILCFVCGSKNVKTPDCPSCSKNKQSTSKN